MPFKLSAIIITFLILKAFSYANINGETGLYRLSTAEVIGAGHMALVLGGDIHGRDKDYSPAHKNVYLINGNVSATYGFNPYLEFNVTGTMHVDRANNTNEGGLGDTRVAAKLIYPPYPHKKVFDLALNIAANFPTGSKEKGSFRRRIFYQDSLNFSAGDTHFELLFPFVLRFSQIGGGAPFKLHAVFGADFTTTSESQDMYKAGIGIEYAPTSYFTSFIEMAGETKAKKGLSPEKDPLWATLGFVLSYKLFRIKFGGEYLISSSAASQVQLIKNRYLETRLYPRFGGFVNLSLTGLMVSQDHDKDGIDDRDDKCPSSPEDFDKFEDKDGCPEPDNDKDGIRDRMDKCPGNPEDMDGFKDGDGCPETDNDEDGIPDAQDKCLNTPEDMDGFQDKDGCPELDNDKDGIPDSEDKCTDKPEDIDNFQDRDGCPETDNDRDGIQDRKDKCPNVPEIFNGINDKDGCPDGKIKLFKVGESRILPDVKFKKGTRLIPYAIEVLNELASLLNYHKEIRIEIKVHSDALGSTRRNKKKTEARAKVIKDYLVSKGISEKRITTRGMGEDFPIAPNESPGGRLKNNRVEISRLQ
jgi:outer membrane protein OmpA-like peptidoglycan-associated protein